eukprot:1161371-Pelagomonas_calceolata.AAC.15
MGWGWRGHVPFKARMALGQREGHGPLIINEPLMSFELRERARLCVARQCAAEDFKWSKTKNPSLSTGCLYVLPYKCDNMGFNHAYMKVTQM